jgi:hypothetical protein
MALNPSPPACQLPMHTASSSAISESGNVSPGQPRLILSTATALLDPSASSANSHARPSHQPHPDAAWRARHMSRLGMPWGRAKSGGGDRRQGWAPWATRMDRKPGQRGPGQGHGSSSREGGETAGGRRSGRQAGTGPELAGTQRDRERPWCGQSLSGALLSGEWSDELRQ